MCRCTMRLSETTAAAGFAAVGHRVVHGGPRYRDPERVDSEMLAALRRISSFDPEHLPLAHLGNGPSIIAVRAGRSVDTTMAFTPSAGLVMSTRSGRATPPLAGWRMEKDFQVGDHVGWNSKAGPVRGTIKKKVPSAIKV